MRLADLDLGALEARLLRGQRLAHQVVGRQVQPAALGGVHRDALLGAAGGTPQRLAVAPAAPVPQRGVDRRQRQAGDRADAGGVGGEQQVAPDRLDQRRVAADQARRTGGRAAAPSPTSRRCRWCSCSRCRSLPSSMRSRTIGVSCVTNDWIASLRGTGGGRSTCRSSMAAMRSCSRPQPAQGRLKAAGALVHAGCRHPGGRLVGRRAAQRLTVGARSALRPRSDSPRLSERSDRSE